MTTLPASEETVPATDMPERIYAARSNGQCVVAFASSSMNYNIEYVRADLVHSERERAIQECAEIVLRLPSNTGAYIDRQEAADAILSLSQVSAKP